MLYKLPNPQLNEANYLGYNIGLRPARKTGPRLEKEYIGNKVIFHNYGHAGYGVAMAYGSCKLVTTMFKNEFGMKQKNVAIIGSGYMGLHTAKILTELGYNVTIYAKTMPSTWGLFGKSNEKLTSQIAAGKIVCEFLPLFENKEQTKLIYQESIDYIKQCYEKKKYRGVFKRPIFMLTPEDETLNWLPESFDPVEKCTITFGNGRIFDGYKSAIFHIDGDIYLNELVCELLGKGISFVKREFANTLDIMKLNETVIFNCTGFQSKYLFSDPLVFALKGIMISYKRHPGLDFYFDSVFTKKIQALNFYPMNERLSVGLTWIHEEDISPDEDEKYRNLVKEVIDDFNRTYINPKPNL